MSMSTDGFTALNYLCQLKSNNANESALEAANSGRQVQKDLKNLRGALQAFEAKVRASGGEETATVTLQEKREISSLLAANGIRSGDVWGLINTTGDNSELGAEGALRTNSETVDRIRSLIEGAIKDREADDKMGNFELQDLMATMNQNQTLASTTLKELTGMRMGTIRNIGG